MDSQGAEIALACEIGDEHQLHADIAASSRSLLSGRFVSIDLGCAMTYSSFR